MIIKSQIYNIIFNNKPFKYKIYDLLHINCLDRKLIIQFAYESSKDLDKFYDIKKYPKIFEARKKCLELVKDFLDGKKVTKDELKKASRDATDVAYAADYTAIASYNAVNAVAYTAYAAASAANQTSRAAASAANQTYAATRAAASAASYAAIKSINDTYVAYDDAYTEILYKKLLKIFIEYYNLNNLMIEALYL